MNLPIGIVQISNLCYFPPFDLFRNTQHTQTYRKKSMAVIIYEMVNYRMNRDSKIESQTMYLMCILRTFHPYTVRSNIIYYFDQINNGQRVVSSRQTIYIVCLNGRIIESIARYCRSRIVDEMARSSIYLSAIIDLCYEF